MEFVKNLNVVNKSDTALAGGKGASLGEMIQAGIPVPPGFVILSTAFEAFLDAAALRVDIDSVLRAVDHKELRTVENASARIQSRILDADFSKDIVVEVQRQFRDLDTGYVAVRSSASTEDSLSAAWAGQLDSFLSTTEETLLKNIKHCWASLFTARAIFYRFEKQLHEQKIYIAVVVQKMINSEISGTAFSVHPVTHDRNRLIIEAGFGLGEAIVSGQITPDSYVVDKKDWVILDINVVRQHRMLTTKAKGGVEWVEIPNEKQGEPKLSGRQIMALAKLVVDIESHYKRPCDIEWAMENARFYITQSRPITTLNR